MSIKKCTTCGKKKKLSEFNKSAERKDGLQTLCRLCSNKRSKSYYKQNIVKQKAAVTANKARYKKRNKEFVLNYLKKHPCIDCGESDIRCLEFDHVRGQKISHVALLLHHVCSLNVIKNEIKKCDVRCANCHRKRTSDTQGWYKSGS